MKNFKLLIGVVFFILLFVSCDNEENVLLNEPRTDAEILA